MYRFVLRDTFLEKFKDVPDAEVSSKALTLAELQQFSVALQKFHARAKQLEEENGA